MDPVVEAALVALSRGWSVVRTGPDKRPIGKWEDLQQAPLTPEQVKRWGKPAGYALITGAISGTIALDFDGQEGRSLLKRLDLKPHTKTGGGGHHVLFRHPGWRVKTLNGKSKTSLGERYPGLDIRGDGGYIVLPPSRSEKGIYEWLREPEPYDLSALPDDLRTFLGLLEPPKEAILGSPRTQHKAQEGYTAPPSASSDVPSPEKILEVHMRSLDLNHRNDEGFRLACQLRDNQASFGAAARIMREYAAIVGSHGSHPYTEDEAMGSLRQAWKEAPREPWRSWPKPSLADKLMSQLGAHSAGR